ncbi:MlaD family protein [Methylocystis sp. IM3]|uniref:MlaD family protein n=1 Tax=unclassified Methylocystis TaxID=2625913 RepID=UPI000FBC9269|nr:MAG: MCE family protein [Hyphomicrobiales bacterium]
MEIRANYLLVGVFVLATLAAALRFAFFILAPAWTSNDVLYEMDFSGPAVGLTLGTPVYFNGLKVGEVTKISIPADSASAVVLAKIDKATPVRTDTTARLRQTELMGSAFISLIGASADAPDLTALPGQRYPRLLVEDARRNYPDLRELYAHFSTTYGRLTETLNGVPSSLSALKWNLGQVDESLQPLLQKPGGGDGARPATINFENLATAVDHLDRLVVAADQFVRSRKLQKLTEVSIKLNDMSSSDLEKMQRLAVELREKINGFDQKLRALGLAPAGAAGAQSTLPNHK